MALLPNWLTAVITPLSMEVRCLKLCHHKQKCNSDTCSKKNVALIALHKGKCVTFKHYVSLDSTYNILGMLSTHKSQKVFVQSRVSYMCM